MSNDRTRRAGPSTESSAPAETPVLSELQEIAFLPVRLGRPWDERQVDDVVRRMKEARELDEGAAATRTWAFGRALLELYNGLPERSKGAKSFVSWAAATFEIHERTVFEYLKIQKVFRTSEVAHSYGQSHLRCAAKLLLKLGLESIDALTKEPLPQPDRSAIHFPATIRQLEDALVLLEAGVTAQSQAAELKAEQEAEEGRGHDEPVSLRRLERLAAERDEKNEKLKVAFVNTPGLEELTARYVVRDGELHFQAGTVRASQLAALAKLLVRIER